MVLAIRVIAVACALVVSHWLVTGPVHAGERYQDTDSYGKNLFLAKRALREGNWPFVIDRCAEILSHTIDDVSARALASSSLIRLGQHDLADRLLIGVPLDNSNDLLVEAQARLNRLLATVVVKYSGFSCELAQELGPPRLDDLSAKDTLSRNSDPSLRGLSEDAIKRLREQIWAIGQAFHPRVPQEPRIECTGDGVRFVFEHVVAGPGANALVFRHEAELGQRFPGAQVDVKLVPGEKVEVAVEWSTIEVEKTPNTDAVAIDDVLLPPGDEGWALWVSPGSHIVSIRRFGVSTNLTVSARPGQPTRIARSEFVGSLEIVGVVPGTDSVRFYGHKVEADSTNAFEIPPGDHEVEVRKGSTPFNLSVTVEAGRRTIVTLPSLVVVESEIEGANVSSDDIPNGWAREQGGWRRYFENDRVRFSVVAAGRISRAYEFPQVPGSRIEVRVHDEDLAIDYAALARERVEKTRSWGWVAASVGVAGLIAVVPLAFQWNKYRLDAQAAFHRYENATDLLSLERERAATTDNQSRASTYGISSIATGLVGGGLLGLGVFLILREPAESTEPLGNSRSVMPLVSFEPDGFWVGLRLSGP